MSSGSLLLLLGFLTLWAELTPVSGQGRPRLCYLPPESGPCLALFRRFHYDPTSNKCQEFVYGGCHGNANNFETRDECHFTCVEKRGVCPQGPQQRPCLQGCQNDWSCPGAQKCCRYGCLAQCKDPAFVKQALPTKKPTRIGPTVRT